ncbi:siderophore-interacting protein [Microbacterium sp. G2-8]|uniref:siderophore-interacting protein n=1 Tax=Microbacterium sp. G2-8 TaxID=2842454 RepID=UPI001C8ABBD9|nr:siderophore-interacting protein [Microbacterium sp. G2-8]
MSNIAVTHAASGLVYAEVARAERVTPHMVRVTLTGDDLRRFEHVGFDQWFRLALPVHGDAALRRMPQRFGMTGMLKWLAIGKDARPVIRNYTVRDFRPEMPELDIDFVVHGDDGTAGPWAQRAVAGERVAFIDQGCGWRGLASDWQLIAADESGLPAAAGILRDLPRGARGHAIIELFDARDRQAVEAPPGVTVHWLVRDPGEAPGARLLPFLADLAFPEGLPYAFVVGEQALAAAGRRHLVKERGIDRRHVTFSGYWKRGATSPS